MKLFAKFLAVALFLVPTMASAQLNTHQGGTGAVDVSTGSILFGSVFNLRMATSSNLQWDNTGNILTAKYASTTAISATTICLATDCKTVWPSGSSIGEAWSIQGTGYLAPTTTRGIFVNASSTIGNGAQTGGLTISGGATTTGNAYFAGKVGVGTNSPGAQVDILSSTFPLDVGSTFVESAGPSLGVYYTATGNLFQFAALSNIAYLNAFAGKAINISANGFGNRALGMTIDTSNNVTIGTLGSGIVKSTSGLLSNATAGTDYVNGSGTSGNCVQWGSTNSLVDAGAPCGSGSGSSFPFTPTTNYGAAANSTSTPLWLTQGIQASTTKNYFAGITVDSGVTGTTTVQIGSVGNPGCVKIRDTDNAGYTYWYSKGGVMYADTNTCE